jgi:hypothetical protein
LEFAIEVIDAAVVTCCCRWKRKTMQELHQKKEELMDRYDDVVLEVSSTIRPKINGLLDSF